MCRFSSYSGIPPGHSSNVFQTRRDSEVTGGGWLESSRVAKVPVLRVQCHRDTRTMFLPASSTVLLLQRFLLSSLPSERMLSLYPPSISPRPPDPPSRRSPTRISLTHSKPRSLSFLSLSPTSSCSTWWKSAEEVKRGARQGGGGWKRGAVSARASRPRRRSHVSQTGVALIKLLKRTCIRGVVPG